MYQFKVWVCAGVCVGGIGVGGGGFEKFEWNGGRVLKYSFVFKGGAQNFF